MKQSPSQDDSDCNTSVVPDPNGTYSLGSLPITFDSIVSTTGDAHDWRIGYDITIERPNKAPLKVAETLEQIMERLCILEPDFDKMDQYPALREAYNNYKLIESLLTEKNNNGQV